MRLRPSACRISWQGGGREGLGPDGRVLIEVDPNYFRPAEVDLLLGDASKAEAELGWKPRGQLRGVSKMMVDADLRLAGVQASSS